MHILVADADRSIEVMLGSEGFNVYGIDSGEEAIELGRLYDYDAIVLGDMPIKVVRDLRAAKVKTPIIVLTDTEATAHIVAMLDVGADDFLSKPFHKSELVSRIRAVVRRSRGHASSVLSCGPLALDLTAQRATVDGQPIQITGKHFKILELLMLRQGQCVTREQILNYLYNGMDEPGSKILDVFVCKMRKILPEGLLETVWGRGYMIAKSGAKANSPAVGPEIRTAFADGFGGYGRKQLPGCLSERSVRELV